MHVNREARPADELRQAATRLQKLTAAATPAPWTRMPTTSLTTEIHGPPAEGTTYPRPVASDVDQHCPGDEDLYDHNCGDADLIVALRSVAEPLALLLLQAAEEDAEVARDFGEFVTERNLLALARVVNSAVLA